MWWAPLEQAVRVRRAPSWCQKALPARPFTLRGDQYGAQPGLPPEVWTADVSSGLGAPGSGLAAMLDRLSGVGVGEEAKAAEVPPSSGCTGSPCSGSPPGYGIAFTVDAAPLFCGAARHADAAVDEDENRVQGHTAPVPYATGVQGLSRTDC